MRRRRLVLGILMGGSLLLGLLWIRRPQPSSSPLMASASAPRAPARVTAPARETPRPADTPREPRAGGPVPIPSPELPASTDPPMIDMPAEPPPEEGSGDDFLESGLPRAVFDAEIALEVEAPSEAKLAALEVSAGHTIAPETREAVKEAFVRQSDAAASAIGTYRLHAIDEDEALRQIGRAREKYETEAARTLGVSRDAFLRAFTSAE